MSEVGLCYVFVVGGFVAGGFVVRGFVCTLLYELELTFMVTSNKRVLCLSLHPPTKLRSTVIITVCLSL